MSELRLRGHGVGRDRGGVEDVGDGGVCGGGCGADGGVGEEEGGEV